MVSELWKASSEGDLARVNHLLLEATVADIEINDQNGMTPLIEAVKNGHYDVVKALLDKGADPNHASNQGLPPQYTSDPAIVDLLRAAAAKTHPEAFQPQPIYPHDPNVDPSKGYYLPPPGPYAYYPGMPIPPLPEGAVPYYPHPPPHPADDQHPQGGLVSNLPPPEIARLIPCRYFPACRYGASCMFAHPQGPYFQGPVPPPAQYSTHYDPMNPHPYPPNFYPMPPPPPFQQANAMPPPPLMTPVSPQNGPQSAPPMAHARSGSDVLSPLQGPYSASGAPTPGSMPYGAISPVSPSYTHPGPLALPLSANQHPPVNGGPLSPVYPPPGPSGPNYDPRRDSIGQYPSAQPAQRVLSEPNGMQKSPPLHVPDSFGPGGHRDGMGYHRRGSFRRPSFGGGRKPPCLFFPSGRCRNGDDCRFPHVMSETTVVPPSHQSHQPHFAGRGGRFRPPPFMNGNGAGPAAIEDKLAAMTLNDDSAPGRQESVGSTTPPEVAANRVRPPTGPKQSNHAAHGARPARPAVIPKQRVPNADEFPVLGGSTTPPSRSPAINGHANGYSGPTAAQVLQAPPPARKDSVKGSSRSETPDSLHAAQASKPASEAVPVAHQDHVNKLPVSFAAVATGAPDASKEVSVSA